MLLFNPKPSIVQLCDFQSHTSKAPGMCTLPGGNFLDFEPYFGGGGGGESNAPFLYAFLSSSPQISNDQLHTFWLLNLTIDA